MGVGFTRVSLALRNYSFSRSPITTHHFVPSLSHKCCVNVRIFLLRQFLYRGKYALHFCSSSALQFVFWAFNGLFYVIFLQSQKGSHTEHRHQPCVCSPTDTRMPTNPSHQTLSKALILSQHIQLRKIIKFFSEVAISQSFPISSNAIQINLPCRLLISCNDAFSKISINERIKITKVE